MFGLSRPEFSRIRNPAPRQSGRDFQFTVFAFLSMLLVAAVVMAAARLLGAPALEPDLAVRVFVAVALAAAAYAVHPRWTSLVFALILAAAALSAFPGALGPSDAAAGSPPGVFAVAALAALIAAAVGPSMQVIAQWDKAIVLRMGTFRRLKGPGVFFLLPVADRCAAVVDTRIRVTDFSAEKIITKDTVPIYVDALAFWMIWDAKRAILEVEDYLQAVTLSAQAALRDTVGRYDLSELLAERTKLYGEIQSILDAKTNPWGITILSVEFVDIRLPKDLEDVMSRQAQAEREKRARLLLGEAELEVAEKFEKASAAYRNNPEALNLRAMTMVYDGMKARGSLVLLPSSALDSMNLGSVLGTAALARDGAGWGRSGTMRPGAGEGGPSEASSAEGSEEKEGTEVPDESERN